MQWVSNYEFRYLSVSNIVKFYCLLLLILFLFCLLRPGGKVRKCSSKIREAAAVKYLKEKSEKKGISICNGKYYTFCINKSEQILKEFLSRFFMI